MLNKNKPAVSVIIVTFNSGESITRCLRSIKQHTRIPYEIVIVDNASTDQTIRMIKKSTVEVKLIPEDRNRGFSRGNNIGVKQSSGRYLMFLNPDTKLKNDAVSSLYNYLESHPDVGLAAPKLEDTDGTPQRSARKLPTIEGAFKEYYLGDKFSFAPFAPNGSQPVDVDCVVGAAMMISRRHFTNAGGFDERFFLYYEDIDLCRKVLKKNLKIRYLPNPVIIHNVGESAASNPRALNLLYQSSRIYHGLVKSCLLYLLLRFRPKPPEYET